MEALSRQVVAFLDLRKRSINLLESFCSESKPSGIISTCSYCRKAKDERGDWVHPLVRLARLEAAEDGGPGD